MIYTPLVKKAMQLCYQAHAGQVDKAGLPYVFHPLHLAEQMDDEVCTVAALLHDVMEDTPITAAELIEMGFEGPIMQALMLLCHREDVPYMEYIAAIRKNPIARRVKLADLAHNADLSRLDRVSPEDRLRAEKYKKAMEMLK
ncbi:MAG: bifunctional (p)ppGpp synthetase/guanosine-3',5'-bis(diphosphate) 3'-pyrophosphohydrolase [Christensenellaceae bacterium]|nr:bifunctional (p)ppGpp synthetase/guanosine-3',5'-bis(diphosphate) 3'-pyrophosphohydrolase [Christensenellaceae bacterium]